MSEQVQLTGHEQDALNAVIAAGGSMGGFEFLGHSDVGTLLKLVNSGLVYLHKGNVVVHKSTLDLAAELDTLRAENARLRKMLYDMTSLSDWYQAGYDRAEYVALNREFDGKPLPKRDESEETE